jgi:RimJ/RimL family protein N-acetyltransferase
MRHEGCLRQHVKKWDAFEDVELYAILENDSAP